MFRKLLDTLFRPLIFLFCCKKTKLNFKNYKRIEFKKPYRSWLETKKKCTVISNHGLNLGFITHI